ncbi:cell division protein ZapA [Microvirga ossetica]|jgi:cell division protein ZapA|uniref:Cell division protein ZapA n=1 Tax=Microvirga ossetica TaxID=1882682 RepID=A0A1B2EEC7_9HYPH|nr:cell division protein ZapA [Microvirga ossetica]ANY78315.1 cell division protein ZapA [Microvirga ossetica]
MPQVTVTIAGHTYRIACAEGEEAHLEGLAAAYDARVEEMRGTFGEIGDLRLHVMAAIAQADELDEAKQRIAALEAEVAALNSVNAARDERLERIEMRLAEGIQMAAERIEGLARSLNAAGQG